VNNLFFIQGYLSIACFQSGEENCEIIVKILKGLGLIMSIVFKMEKHSSKKEKKHACASIIIKFALSVLCFILFLTYFEKLKCLIHVKWFV